MQSRLTAILFCHARLTELNAPARSVFNCPFCGTAPDWVGSPPQVQPLMVGASLFADQATVPKQRWDKTDITPVSKCFLWCRISEVTERRVHASRKKVSLQLLSEQSAGDVRIKQLDRQLSPTCRTAFPAQHLRPSGVLSCWPDGPELTPRFYLGSNEQHRLF